MVGVFGDYLPLPFGVFEDPIPDFEGKVEALPIFFQKVDHSQALSRMVKSSRANLVEDLLSGMTEGSVSQVMSQGNGFGKVFIQEKGFGHGAGDLRDLQSMGKSGAIMVPGGRQKHLCFMLEAAEGFGMDDPVPVMLEGRANTTLFLGQSSPPALRAELGIGG